MLSLKHCTADKNVASDVKAKAAFAQFVDVLISLFARCI